MAEKSLGTTLTKLMSGSEVANLVIAGLTKLGGVNVKRDEIDATTHDSVDEYAENIPGKKDAGEVPYEGIVKTDADVSKLNALLESGAIESWEQVSPNGSKWAFTAWVKEFGEGEAVIDGVRTYAIVLRITGKPVFTEAGASA